MVTLGSTDLTSNSAFVANWIKGIKLNLSRPFWLRQMSAYLQGAPSVQLYGIYDRNYNLIYQLGEVTAGLAAAWCPLTVNKVIPRGEVWAVVCNGAVGATTSWYVHSVADCGLAVSDGVYDLESPLVAPTLQDHLYAITLNGQYVEPDGRLCRTVDTFNV